MRRTRSRPAIQAGILIQSKTDLSACLHSLTMSIWRQKLQQSAGNFCLHSKVLDKVDDKECMKEDAMSELIYGDNTKVGYKVFLPDWRSGSGDLPPFEVGVEYVHNGKIEICESGFHYCENLIDCFEYYDWDIENKVCLIHVDGSVSMSKGNKSVTSKFTIIRELDWNEVFKVCNTGLNCTGNRNSGNRNSGNMNSGNRNSGDRNSGDRNSGNWNSGNWNSGNMNSGNMNSGDRNSGNWNSGNWNSGNWNSGNWNSGYLNSKDALCYILDAPSNLTNAIAIRTEWFKFLINLNFPLNEFIFESDMTDSEKEKFPHYITLGGYLRTLTYKESWEIALKNISEKEKDILRSIPNWDAEIFYEITGVRI